MPSQPIPVNVTESDIAIGKGGSCYSCPVAIALLRATGDPDAEVTEIDWTLRIGVHGRHIVAPTEVRQFVRDFDSRERLEDGRVDFSRGGIDLEPFSFEIPALDAPEWEEKCGRCGLLFDPSELSDDGNGHCEDCRK